MARNQLIFPYSLLWKEVKEGTDAGTQEHSGEGQVLCHYDVQAHTHHGVDWPYLNAQHLP